MKKDELRHEAMQDAALALDMKRNREEAELKWTYMHGISWGMGATTQRVHYADIPGVGRVFRETTTENGKTTTLFYMNGDRRTWAYLHHLIGTKNAEK